MKFTVVPVAELAMSHAETCPIATALRRATRQRVRAGYGTIACGDTVYVTPPAVREWMMDYDFGRMPAYGVIFDTDTWVYAGAAEIHALSALDVYHA